MKRSHRLVVWAAAGILLLLVAAIYFGGARRDAGPYVSIWHEARSLQWREVLRQFQGRVWAQDFDARMLLLYCEAIAEDGRPTLGEYLDSATEPVRVFADGYIGLMRGDLRAARATFEQLAQSGDGRELGILGLLEYGATIENPKILGEALRRARTRQSHDRALPVQTEEYEIYHDFLNGDYGSVRARVMKQLTREDPTSYWGMRLRLLLRNDEFVQFRKELTHYYRRYGRHHEIVLIEADAVARQFGNEKAIEFIRSQLKQYPQYWGLQQALAFNLSAMGRNREAIAEHNDLVRRRPGSVSVLTSSVLLAAYDEQPRQEALTQLRTMLRDSAYRQIPALNAGLSRLAYRAGRRSVAMEYLNRGLEDSPNNFELLSTASLMALEEGGFKRAEELLQTRLQLEPFDVGSLADLMYLYTRLGRRNDAADLARRIRSLARFVPDSVAADADAVLLQLRGVVGGSHAISRVLRRTESTRVGIETAG